MTPTASKTATEGSSLGSLATLPREIRDEIYQYLFSGSYKAISPSYLMLTGLPERRSLEKMNENGRDMPMLQVSEVIKDEVASAFYSNGVFLCCLFSPLRNLCLPQASIDRMMKIVLDVYPHPDVMNEAWETTIEKLTATTSTRKSIHVTFQGCISLVSSLRKVSKDLKTMTRYRMVIVEFLTTEYPDWQYATLESQATNDNRVAEDLQLLSEAFAGDLKSALGPATLNYTNISKGRPAYTLYTSCLRFYPLNHIAMNSDTSSVENET